MAGKTRRRQGCCARLLGSGNARLWCFRQMSACFCFCEAFCMQPFIKRMEHKGSHICIDTVFNSECKHVKHNDSLLVRWPCLRKVAQVYYDAFVKCLGANVFDTRVWGIKKKKATQVNHHCCDSFLNTTSLQYASQDIIPSKNTCRGPVVCFWSSVGSAIILMLYDSVNLKKNKSDSHDKL